MTALNDLAALTFSTDTLPERERISVWRELFGRTLLRVDIEPLPDAPFKAKATLHRFPQLGVIAGTMCGAVFRRTHDLMTDGNDDLMLAVNVGEPAHMLQGRLVESIVSHRGREMIVRPGEAVLMSNADTSTFTGSQGRFVGLRIPRAILAPSVANVEDALMRLIPKNNSALALLRGYFDILDDADALKSREFRHLIAAHIIDLAAMAIGATSDARKIANDGGLRAARLRAIKADIVRNLADHNLSIATIAARHQISPVYVRKLLSSEGTTFSDLLLEQRLSRAHRMLTDLVYCDRAVSAIAFECGFGDLSHFNRAFRRRFGKTPSDVRDTARRRS